MAYQPKHMRLSAESSDGTLSEETLSKALDQTFDEPPVVDTIVVPETFHQPIEDEASSLKELPASKLPSDTELLSASELPSSAAASSSF